MFILKNTERDADQVGNLRYKLIGTVLLGKLFSHVFVAVHLDSRIIHV